MIVIGDNKQVAPKAVKNEWANEINALAPYVPSRCQLQNGRSVFDVFSVAFPSKPVNMLMREQFRSHPRIVRLINDLFYNGNLRAMRSVGKRNDVLINEHVDLGQKPRRGDPVAFARMIERVKNIIAEYVGSKQTIGIISFSNVKEARTEIVKYKEKLIEQAASIRDIEAHNITVGTPDTFQGDERDIMILLDGEIGKCQQDAESNKNWNVALSRAKEKIHLVCAYTRDHLKAHDIRREILRHFNESNAPMPDWGPTDRVSRASSIHKLYSETRNLLKRELCKNGFDVFPNSSSNTWATALRVSMKDVEEDALIVIENCGESDETWETRLKQQLSLEGANRNCLRIPLLNLCLDFQASVACTLQFLKNAGLGLDPSQSCAMSTSASSNDTVTSASQSNKKRPPPDSNSSSPSKRVAIGPKNPEEELSDDDDDEDSWSSSNASKNVANSTKDMLQKDGAIDEDEDDCKMRARVFFAKLHFKAHKKDLKLELSARGINVLMKTPFTEMKQMLQVHVQEHEDDDKSFLPISTAKFEEKK